MRKDVTLLEAMRITGKDAYDLIGVNRETKQLIRRSVNTVVGSNALVEAIKEEKNTVIESTIEEVVDIAPIDKPSNRFDIDDYILYREYMIANGGVPSIEDYFKAIEYYKSRA